MVPQFLKDAADGQFISQQIGELIQDDQLRPLF
jgi:hypothetical protein